MKFETHLEGLVAKYIEGRCGADELKELEALLLEDAGNREYFLETVLFDQDLGMLGGARPAKTGESPLPVEILLQRQRRQAVRASLLAAAAVILITTVVLWLQMIPAHPATLAGFRAAPNSAFILTHAGDSEEPMGNVLDEGSRIVIEHGVVELALPHEVRAVVEAPASITLVDARTLQLDHGCAFFQVSSEKGRGFTVVTPHQRIVDLGTAFGLDTQPGRDTVELHVFEGRVRIDPPDSGTGEILAAPRSVLLAGTRVREELDGPPAAFLRELPPKVETLLHEDFESGLVGGRDYSILIDPTLIRDLAGNRFGGIAKDGPWDFSTARIVPQPVSFHDFGNEPSPGHITTQRSLKETVDLVNLADGVDTGINFRFEGTGEVFPFKPSRAPGPDTPAGDLFLSSGINLDNGFFADSEVHSPGPAMLVFSGLRPGLRYDIALYGDRGQLLPDPGPERFTLQGAEGANNFSSTGIVGTFVTELVTKPLSPMGHLVRWTGIDPGPDGVVSVEVDSSISGPKNVAYVCGFRVAVTSIDGRPANFDASPFDESGHADGDGLPDSFELAHTDPPSATALDPDDDLDRDGLTNLQEFQHRTDPHNSDTDGDGVPDGAELAAGTDPTAAPALDESDGPPAAGSDIIPPALVFRYPADDSSDALPGERLTMTFNEPIKLGTGRFTLRNVTDWSETVMIAGQRPLSVDGRVLTITPPADLADGKMQLGRVSGWESHGWPGIFNPSGEGTWYQADELKDDGRARGMIGAMRGPIMATFAESQPGSRIRREFAAIVLDQRYTVSAAIGVRADDATAPRSFDGYTIRLSSGDTVLAELTNDTPPGPSNSVTNVGLSWDSSVLPDGISPGDPLAIEIAPNQASGEGPGYLDIDNVRVTMVGRTGASQAR